MELVLYSQEVCGPCRNVESFFESEGVSDKVKTVKMEEHLEEFIQNDITSTPVTVLLDNEGSEVERVYGAKLDDLERLIDNM